jgi:hypothetical protein
VRYRTAIILSCLLIGGIIGIQVATEVAWEHGLVKPQYQRMLYGPAEFLITFKWFLIPPIVGALFFIAALTSTSRGKN